MSNLKGDACCSSMKLAQTKAAAKGLDPPNNTAVIVGVSIAGIVLILLIFFFYVKGKNNLIFLNLTFKRQTME